MAQLNQSALISRLNQKVTGITGSNGLAAGKVNAKSLAQAQAKVQKWTSIIEGALRSALSSIPNVRGGALAGDITTSAPATVGHAVHSLVTWSNHPAHSMFGPKYDPSADLVRLLIGGWQVKSPNVSSIFRSTPGLGIQPPTALVEKVYSAYVGAAAADGVTLTMVGRGGN